MTEFTNIVYSFLRAKSIISPAGKSFPLLSTEAVVSNILYPYLTTCSLQKSKL